jgi:hypothetical protein
MSAAPIVPDTVFTIWQATVGVTLVVFVPLAVYLLHATWRAARSIEAYADDARVAAEGIARNTSAIPALDATIATATEILGAATDVRGKLETAAGALASRVR